MKHFLLSVALCMSVGFACSGSKKQPQQPRVVVLEGSSTVDLSVISGGN